MFGNEDYDGSKRVAEVRKMCGLFARSGLRRGGKYTNKYRMKLYVRRRIISYKGHRIDNYDFFLFSFIFDFRVISKRSSSDPVNRFKKTENHCPGER